MSEHNDLHDLGHFFHAHTKVAKARADREAASAHLDLEQIRERMYELRCHHEPLNTLTNGDREERDRILQAIFYVVVGRFPEEKS